MDNDAIRDLFAGLGPVAIKRMFGGKGIYFEGRIVALEVGGEILLKADKLSAADFEAAGCRQWRYAGKSKPVAMPYWSIPEDAFDDPDIMVQWARRAHEASIRTAK
ncbi:MAG: TfoX/Sxy family protein [Phyllobacterium sp.]